MTDLESAKQKLLWCLGGEWSVAIRPAEARALLDELGVDLTGTVDKRQVTLQEWDSERMRSNTGDPGDEQQ